MSPAQRAAIQRAWDILTEHFDQVLLVANWECDDEHGDRTDAHEGFWHGGSISAIGLAEFAKDRILRAGVKFNAPGKPEEPGEEKDDE